MKKLGVYFLIVAMGIPNFAFAQQQQQQLPPQQPGQNTQQRFGPKRQATVIIFAGLGGAVLGLSTLSFYGRPQDKLSNIAIGAAVGIIVGTIYVTYKAATQPAEFYGEGYRGTMLENPHSLSRDPTEMLANYKWEF
jgi:hypothetical protein